MPSQTILIVEDERDIAELIAFNLKREGYTVVAVSSGEEGLQQARAIQPDLIVLDIMLPGLNGLDVCRNLKAEPATNNIRIIMLTARDDDIDVVTGLEVGADDYLTKPFSPKVLVARTRAVLRRPVKTAGDAPLVQSYGELEISPEKRQVLVSGEAINLTHTRI
jgi:two-component system phosphate regulon response regulator PhoB